MATLATLRNSVSRKLGLDNTSAGDQPLIDENLNQGILEILLRTHCTLETASMDTIADEWQYQLPTSILAIEEMWREDSANLVELCVRESDTSIFYRHRVTANAADSGITYYAVKGSNLLLVWPIPSAVYALKILYVPRPTALSAAGDDPSSEGLGRIPSEFHKLIEFYALGEMADYDDDQGSQHGDRYRTLFEQGISELRRAIRHKGGKRLSPATLKPRKGYLVYSDPARTVRY